MLAFLRIALSLALVGPPPELPVRDPAALDLFWKGVAAYEVGDYAAAAAAFEAAHAIEAAPELLYSIGNMRRLAGDCDAAVDALERYLETDPSPEPAADARAAIEACADALPEPEPTPAPREPAPAPALAPTQVTSPSTPVAPRPWFRDPVGGTLLGVGTAGLAVGLGFAIAAGVHDRRALSADAHENFLELTDRRRLETTVAIAATAAGSALVIGAIVRYALLRRDERRGARSAHRSRAVLSDPQVVVVSGDGLIADDDDRALAVGRHVERDVAFVLGAVVHVAPQLRQVGRELGDPHLRAGLGDRSSVERVTTRLAHDDHVALGVHGDTVGVVAARRRSVVSPRP